MHNLSQQLDTFYFRWCGYGYGSYGFIFYIVFYNKKYFIWINV